MDLLWKLYYLVYAFASIRFFLHTSVLAFPIPRQRFKYKKSNKKILIQYPICNEPIELIHRFLKSLETIPKEERHRVLLQICDDSSSPIPFKSLSACVRLAYTRRWDDISPHPHKIKNKASNMNYGLSRASKEYEYVAIYDADHIMDGTGLIKAAEILEAENKTVCIQSRWVPIKRLNTALSWLQEQIFHVHIEREQAFKSVYNLWPIFNGAGGIWKRDFVEEVFGGWIIFNPCEDTDISGLTNARGYKIKVLPTWTTLIDNVYDWKSYRTQQRRWASGNSIQLQRHLRDPYGWGLKKLYWMSWNIGHLVGLTKWVIPAVMTYKYFTTGLTWLDWGLTSPHIFAWITSCVRWNNTPHYRGLITYPMHYLIEFAVLPWQLFGWVEGFIFWKTKNDFVVTNKKVC